MNKNKVDKTILTHERIRRDIYNAKMVWLETILLCLCIFVFFRSRSIILIGISLLTFLRTLKKLNERTLSSFSIDKGDYFIVAKDVYPSGIELEQDNGKVFIPGDFLYDGENNEVHKMFFIYVNNKVKYAYLSSQYSLDSFLEGKLNPNM